MRLDGLVGEHGSTPREWRASFLRRGAAGKARDKVLGWKAERLLIAPTQILTMSTFGAHSRHVHSGTMSCTLRSLGSI
jgi:hypothetical protein